jgi:hypothetical protein
MISGTLKGCKTYFVTKICNLFLVPRLHRYLQTEKQLRRLLPRSDLRRHTASATVVLGFHVPTGLYVTISLDSPLICILTA